MPRQDVPYGGAICRLKERIAEIWDKLDQKLHSINGVEGDGAGNVEIVSGDAAVVIDNDQVGHRIEVSLDSSKLPAAAVSSVNGQTGAVRLDAADIPSDGNSNVQADIAANKMAINALSGDIASEQTARQAADATLQTNINAVSASIPEMSVTPDPYKGVKRDAQGRASAADPASGATDKTLVTANWVSQTGEGKPNNVVHDSGNEVINGTKNFISAQNLKSVSSYYRNTDKKNGWIEVYNFDTEVTSFLIEIMGNSNNDVGYYSKFFVTAISPTEGWINFVDSAYQNTSQRVEILLTHDGTKYAIWCKFVTYRYANVSIIRSGRYGTESDTNIVTIVGEDRGQTKPSSPDYTIIADEVDDAATVESLETAVAQLAEDVPNKLDKISSGSTLKAYTHNGQNQGETAVVDGIDANSIGLRDANGRMQAADPASGATDKTLVTANWVSQTGDGAPNNLIHRRGVETILDTKIIKSSDNSGIFRLQRAGIDITGTVTSAQNIIYLPMQDTNGVNLITLIAQRRTDNGVNFYAQIRNADGSYKFVLLGSGDA